MAGIAAVSGQAVDAVAVAGIFQAVDKAPLAPGVKLQIVGHALNHRPLLAYYFFGHHDGGALVVMVKVAKAG